MNIGNTYSIHGKITTDILSVAVLQFPSDDAGTWDEVDQNIDRIIDFMEKAVSGFPGVDLLVTPECSVQGVHAENWLDVLLTKEDKFIRRLKNACKELNVWGIFNPWMKPRKVGVCDNVMIIINNNGEIVHDYTKMHPWLPAETTTPGSELPVCEGPKGSRIATLLSSDGEYPEMWREAAFGGANVIVRSSHYMSPFDQGMKITNRAMAYTNQLYVVECNPVGLDDQYSYFGGSEIIGPDGTAIIEAPLGASSIIKSDLYPGIIDHMRKYAVASNPLYTYKHRGASCPNYKGGGINTTYRAYSHK